LDAYLFENIPAETWTPAAAYDIPASLDEFSEAFVRAMEALEPTGCCNPECVFRTTVQLIESRAIGAQGAHLRLIASQNGMRRTGIFFGAGNRADLLGESAEILYTPQINIWNGRTDVQLMLSAMRERDTQAQIQAANSSESAILRNFLTELIYNRGYNSLTLEFITLRELRLRMSQQLQGTMILCPCLESASEVLKGIDPAAPDLFIGRMSDDRRLYNALCVCPDQLDFPKALRTLVLADVPVPKGLNENVQVYALEGIESAVWHDLPDVNQMREVYKACLHISRRPAHMPDWDALDAQLAQFFTDLQKAALLLVQLGFSESDTELEV